MARDFWERERLDPVKLGAGHGHVREHLARYRFAADRLGGRILDAGCGTGYGSLILAGGLATREVVAVDHDPRAIDHARRTYGSPVVDYRSLDLMHSRCANLGLFEGVACFEVLEHVVAPERLLAQLDLCLAPAGRLIISTPVGRGRAVPSSQPGHHFQLLRSEFESMLAERFRFRLFGQKGAVIEEWRPGQRYFVMIAVCQSSIDA